MTDAAPDTHSLSILVNRGSGYIDPETEGLNKAEKTLMRLFRHAALPNSCVYVQLKHNDKTTTYFYNFQSRRIFLRNVFIASTINMAASLVSGALDITMGPVQNLVHFFFPLVATFSPGTAQRRLAAPSVYHTGISMRISQERYLALRKRLRADHRKGMYALLFNNCASYASRIAQEAGMPIKSRPLIMPHDVANQIDRYFAKQKREASAQPS